MEIPCKNCITLGVCRHKHYQHLLQECSILRHLLYEDGDMAEVKRTQLFDAILEEVENTMEPSMWIAHMLKVYRHVLTKV